MIEVEDLSVMFRVAHGTVTAVRQASFAVAAGESFGIVGESGSGKSTVLRAIAGLVAPQTGTIRVDRRLMAVTDTTRLTKADMPENTALPDIRVDPDTFTVSVDGEVWEPEPVSELPMAQRYFLF